ncbi:MAG: DnaB-like helicase C-terminal domain-containing protein [Bacteroidota bacterium]|jgi:replicative DNA helicase|nr:hypothetical protein [Ignavibacteria bacterium]MCU7525308.1 hypothetical protein [Ignavibacteria bacterium]HEX2960938.1 DnaB-like helicase C-terminal domain-containing protein [Ignavibacteriales bacterium]
MKDNSNLKLEYSALHSMLISEQGFLSAAAVNPPAEIFSCMENRIIYSEAMNYFYSTGRAPGLRTLHEKLILEGKPENLRAHLRERIGDAEFMRNTGDAIKLLTEIKIEREIREYFASTRETGLDFAMDIISFINETFKEYIGGCVRERKNSNVAETVLKEIQDAVEGKSSQYIRTLIPELDRQVIGIPKNHLTVIAARTGMGKTDFMLQLMRNFMKQGLKPAVFSLEMESESLFLRNISEAARIDSMRIENGELNQGEMEMLSEASKKYSGDDYLIDDGAAETPETIKAKINYWRLKHNVNVIMVDYITLIDTSYHKERYDLEIGALMREMRVFAKDTGIPIILISQLNRDSEKRQDHRPQISDLKESSSIEQEAKLVMMLYRPKKYGIDPFEGKEYTFYDMFGNQIKADEYMEIIVNKARNGRTGIVPVQYIPAMHRIEGVKCIKSKLVS